MDNKRVLRTGVWTARAGRPAVDREADGARLASHAADLLALARGPNPTVAAYAGIAEEPPTRQLLDALSGQGARVILPVVTDDHALDWAPYEGWEALATVRWGLLEPTAPRLGPATVETAALVVVPALGVDRHGNRLGRGKGFYDRTLARVAERTRRIAVVYAGEIFDRVPHEAHDEPVGWALTPDGLIELAQPVA